MVNHPWAGTNKEKVMKIRKSEGVAANLPPVRDVVKAAAAKVDVPASGRRWPDGPAVYSPTGQWMGHLLIDQTTEELRAAACAKTAEENRAWADYAF